MIFTSPPLTAIKLLHGCQVAMLGHKWILFHGPHTQSSLKLNILNILKFCERTVVWSSGIDRGEVWKLDCKTVPDSTSTDNKYRMFLLSKGIKIIKAMQKLLNIICLWGAFSLPVVTCSDHSNHGYWCCSCFSFVSLCIQYLSLVQTYCTFWGCSPSQLTQSPLSFLH